MPNQNSPYAGEGYLNFSSAPGGDAFTLDDLFPEAEGQVSPTPATPEHPQVTSQPQADPSSEPDYFLRAGKSVYKTREDAEKSLEYKDSLIEDMRQKAIAKFGYDLANDRPTNSTPSQPSQAQPVNYAQDGKKFYYDLSDAVSKQDAGKYAEVTQKFVYDLLAPVAPLLGEVARTRAERITEGEIADFGNFKRSNSYTETLSSMPVLKQAIEVAENSPEAANQLPDLYKLAYFAGQGRRVPELMRAQQTASQAQPTPARPTTTPSTMAPPPPAPPPDLRTSEGRKAIMAAAEAKGVADYKW